MSEMQYMGSKARFAKEILPIVLRNRKEGQFYVEPFCGGENVIDKVDGNRIANDFHPHLICLLRAVSCGWIPPLNVSEDEYKSAKGNQEVNPITAFIGFGCSFGTKWFGGYARNSVGTNYAKMNANNLLKQAPGLKGIDFRCGSYLELDIPPMSIIYCDPPYEGTTKYSTSCINYKEFWQWCRDMASAGHTVFVSEYNAPYDFQCVWEKKTNANFDSSRTSGSERVERLFTWRPA